MLSAMPRLFPEFSRLRVYLEPGPEIDHLFLIWEITVPFEEWGAARYALDQWHAAHARALPWPREIIFTPRIETEEPRRRSDQTRAGAW